MTAVLHRLRDFFVAPAAPAARVARPAVAERALPSAVAVLCAPGDVAAAHAVGLVLAVRGGTGCAVVCRWAGAASRGDTALGGSSAFPAAGALARRLRARHVQATAAGRLVLVDLAPDAGDAAGIVGRVGAAAGDAPLVVAVAGPRPAEFGDVLATQDRVLVAPPVGAPEGMAELALVDASRASRGAGLLELRWGTGARGLATRGLALPRAVRDATLAALEGRDG